MKARSRTRRAPVSSIAALDEMIEAATVDACGSSEQITGFHAMLDAHLAVPFKTKVLDVEVTVTSVDVTSDERIVAVCVRGRARQRIPILDLPLPDPRPSGAEWIEAYRRWAHGRW